MLTFEVIIALLDSISLNVFSLNLEIPSFYKHSGFFPKNTNVHLAFAWVGAEKSLDLFVFISILLQCGIVLRSKMVLI